MSKKKKNESNHNINDNNYIRGWMTVERIRVDSYISRSIKYRWNDFFHFLITFFFIVIYIGKNDMIKNKYNSFLAYTLQVVVLPGFYLLVVYLNCWFFEEHLNKYLVHLQYLQGYWVWIIQKYINYRKHH